MSGWDDYRRRRLLFVIAVVGYLPAAFVLGTLAAALTGIPPMSHVVALHWMGFMLVAGVRWAGFPCPRCGRPFLGGLLEPRNPFRGRCRWCGLWRWEQPDGAGRPEANGPNPRPGPGGDPGSDT